MIESLVSITAVNTFGDRLKYARLQRGMTQERLAQLSRVSQSAIGNYESALRSTSRSLLKLAKALGVNATWLESGQLPMEPTAPGQLLLRDEVQQPIAANYADTALISAQDYQRYLALDAHDRRFLRQALHALIQTLETSGTREPTAPSKPAARRAPRKS